MQTVLRSISISLSCIYRYVQLRVSYHLYMHLQKITFASSIIPSLTSGWKKRWVPPAVHSHPDRTLHPDCSPAGCSRAGILPEERHMGPAGQNLLVRIGAASPGRAAGA